MKAIAVISIIAAHCKLPNYTGEAPVISVMQYITTYLGEVGVPIFFALSGYLFHTNDSLADFVRKKAIHIVLPWIFCSFLVWVYMAIQGDSYNIITWILGLTNVYW
ncbi:MAG: acyltransferase family protein, partial [Clostridiales bacterium]|nr:acyltransferase family protein [Clostridiales bacterium]